MLDTAMLTISTDTLPQSGLSYVAFRIAFRDTLERIVLAAQVDDDTECFGFLTEVPFLRSVPPHVQLDLLAETWRKHAADEAFEASLVDESVIYAACETAAWVVEHDPGIARLFLKGGPQPVEIESGQLAEELRGLHLSLSNEGDFLLISQFEDLPPDEALKLKIEFGIDPERLEPMFDALARWRMSPEFLGSLIGLFTKEEIVRSAWALGVK
ncbi:MAG: hypothetical protein KY476_01025 [Planctomycetes bacterium]|nr:hypothetical protein [Planctomycetota bacterium]